VTGRTAPVRLCIYVNSVFFLVASVVGRFPCSVCPHVFLVTADLAAGIFHIYAGNRLRADDGSVFVGFKQMKSPFFYYQGLIV